MGIRLRAGLTAITLLCVLAVAFLPGSWRVLAAQEPPSGPDRYTIVNQAYTSYEWWLTAWAKNKIVCTMKIDHEGLPTGGDIYGICGDELYYEWIDTQPCPAASTDPGACSGYYLHFVKSEPAQRQVGVILPPPVVWVTLDGCIPYNSTFRCDKLPTLILTGEEPLAGERITNLAGRVDGRNFTCNPVCQVDLGPTAPEGLLLEFWANSSYGDSSILFTARVRVAASEDADDHSWYVDVLSTQWRGGPQASCSQIWEAFPPIGGVPDWLSAPQRAEDLASNIPYEYLATNLIKQGIVNASGCANSGLTEDGQVNACGIDEARTAVTEWQNRFDNLIFSAALDIDIPAQVLKNIFSRESQFWPGVSAGQPEAGLGQLTENGADTTLLWNRSFFEQFCPTVLDNGLCRRGYPQLQEDQQLSLRRALVRSVDAFCPDCPLGINLARAENSVGIFAETLLANCEQTGMIVYNVYGGTAGNFASYEDLWRFTLVNYNAGPGCLTIAIEETASRGETLNWESLSSHLTPVCQGALDYVADISGTTP